MGKPFATELARLSETYDWARGVSVDSLSDAIQSIQSMPLMAVGSGGSFTTAPLTSHTETNIDILKRFLPIQVLSKELTTNVWQVELKAG